MGKRYWDESTERSVRDYISETDPAARNRIFCRELHRPIKNLCEGVWFSYYGPRSDSRMPTESVRDWIVDAQAMVYESLDKYDPNFGNRSFAYFTTIVKNFYFGRARDLRKELARRDKHVTVQSSGWADAADGTYAHEIPAPDGRDEEESDDFVAALCRETDLWYYSSGSNDGLRAVACAVSMILKEPDILSDFMHGRRVLQSNVLVLISEVTGLSRVTVKRKLSELKERYDRFRSDHFSG